MINRKFLFVLLVPIFLLALITSSCDSGGDGTNDGGIQREGVTIQGALSDVVTASADVKDRSKLIAFIENIITKVARAQTTTVLEGILVEVFDNETDPDTPITSDITDANGEFTLEGVPCDTPLKLRFTHDGTQVTLEEGVIAPCPEGEDTGVLTMTFSINFLNGDGSNDDVDEQEEVDSAPVNCSGGEQDTMVETDIVIDGQGGACVIAAGNCELEMVAASVRLVNCSTCIDTRGNSSVEISTTEFECDASEDGIRSVGTSEVEIDVLALAEIVDDEPMSSEMGELLQLLQEDDSIIGSGSGDMLINAGEDGVDLRGNTKLELSAAVVKEDDDEDDADDDDDDNNDEGDDDDDDNNDGGEDGMNGDDDDDNDDLPIFVRDGEGGNIIIEGSENGIIAVGNSEAEVRGFNCEIFPGTTSKGNAEIEVECGQPSDEDDDGDDDDDDS